MGRRLSLQTGGDPRQPLILKAARRIRHLFISAVWESIQSIVMMDFGMS